MYWIRSQAQYFLGQSAIISAFKVQLILLFFFANLKHFKPKYFGRVGSNFYRPASILGRQSIFFRFTTSICPLLHPEILQCIAALWATAAVQVCSLCVHVQKMVIGKTYAEPQRILHAVQASYMHAARYPYYSFFSVRTAHWSCMANASCALLQFSNCKNL